MKKQKIITFGLAASVFLAPLVMGTSAFAWGPEDRPTYTNANPADHAVFNSIIDNAAVGDERDFVRIEEKGSGRDYSSEIILEAGKQYEVYIYYHNDASETYNDQAHDLAGVARDVRLSSDFPKRLAANERQAVTGRITSTTTNPEAVWDEAYVTAKEAMTLHYVTGSAKIYNQWASNGSTLSINLFSPEGTFLGQNTLNGLVMGCDKYSGQVVYTIQTYAIDENIPEGPVDPTKPDDPEVPDELPTTGPVEIVLAVVIVIAVCAGGVYWWKTSKEVKKTTKRAKGRK